MIETSSAGRLSLGPLLYNWPAGKARDFYLRVADEMDVDRVFLGEVVCSKREVLHQPYWPQVIERLERAGKQIILSTLALVTTEREGRNLRSLCSEAGSYAVEINDLSLLGERPGQAFVLGPYINIYNPSALGFFERMGATLITLPFELSRQDLAVLAKNAKSEIEVQVFGRLPLAISARCYHARAFGLHKDGCQYVCDRHSDGMEVNTLEGQPFLCVNGVQTQSRTCVNLIEDISDLQSIGINSFRLSPQSIDMLEVARLFRQVQRGVTEPTEAMAGLKALWPDVSYANGFYHAAEGRNLKRAAGAAIQGAAAL